MRILERDRTNVPNSDLVKQISDIFRIKSINGELAANQLSLYPARQLMATVCSLYVPHSWHNTTPLLHRHA